jgi:hypothetical protein
MIGNPAVHLIRLLENAKKGGIKTIHVLVRVLVLVLDTLANLAAHSSALPRAIRYTFSSTSTRTAPSGLSTRYKYFGSSTRFVSQKKQPVGDQIHVRAVFHRVFF